MLQIILSIPGIPNKPTFPHIRDWRNLLQARVCAQQEGDAMVLSGGNGAAPSAAAVGAGEPAAQSMRAKRKRRSILEAQGTMTA